MKGSVDGCAFGGWSGRRNLPGSGPRKPLSTYTGRFWRAEQAMKLLLLTPQTPFPPRQGTAIGNWAILRHLARAHQVTLLTFADHRMPQPATELQAVSQ